MYVKKEPCKWICWEVAKIRSLKINLSLVWVKVCLKLYKCNRGNHAIKFIVLLTILYFWNLHIFIFYLKDTHHKSKTSYQINKSYNKMYTLFGLLYEFFLLRYEWRRYFLFKENLSFLNLKFLFLKLHVTPEVWYHPAFSA